MHAYSMRMLVSVVGSAITLSSDDEARMRDMERAESPISRRAATYPSSGTTRMGRNTVVGHISRTQSTEPMISSCSSSDHASCKSSSVSASCQRECEALVSEGGCMRGACSRSASCSPPRSWPPRARRRALAAARSPRPPRPTACTCAKRLIPWRTPADSDGSRGGRGGRGGGRGLAAARSPPRAHRRALAAARSPLRRSPPRVHVRRWA